MVFEQAIQMAGRGQPGQKRERDKLEEAVQDKAQPLVDKKRILQFQTLPDSSQKSKPQTQTDPYKPASRLQAPYLKKISQQNVSSTAMPLEPLNGK